MSKFLKGIFTWENMLLSLLITIPYWIFGYPWQVQIAVVCVCAFAYGGIKATIKAIRLHHKKPPQLAAPKSGLERLKEQYALGEIDLAQLEVKTAYELYIQTHAILPEPETYWKYTTPDSQLSVRDVFPALPEPRKTYPEPRNEILWRVKKYQEENAPHE